MIEIIKDILQGLIIGRYKPDVKFEFEEVDTWSDDRNYGATQDVNFNIQDTDHWIMADINWSCRVLKGMKGNYLTPDDPDEYTLDYIEIENFIFGDGESENKIDLYKYPDIKKLFIKYLTSLWNGEVDRKLLREKSIIRNFDSFMLEWGGFGGSEGDVNQKDPVLVSDRMIDEIPIEYEEGEDDGFDQFEYDSISILKDISENLDELDYEEEEDEDGDEYKNLTKLPANLPEIKNFNVRNNILTKLPDNGIRYDYINWRDEIYHHGVDFGDCPIKFLDQLNIPVVNDYLDSLEKCIENGGCGENHVDQILGYLFYDYNHLPMEIDDCEELEHDLYKYVEKS